MSTPILPGAVLGVLGGGQLGRMFTLAARRMGYRVTILAPEDDPPAGQIAYKQVQAGYTDLEQVERFARQVEVVTFEFENVPAAAAATAARFAPVRPAGELLHLTQNRGREKNGLANINLPVAPFQLIESADNLKSAGDKIGFPSVLKSTQWGYDGHGQRRVTNQTQLDQAWVELGSVPAVLESWIEFECELSVVGVRGVDGEVALYDPVQNIHENHVLDITLCPAPVSPKVIEDAKDIARQVLTKLDVVGVLCVELFLLPNGDLMVNELAPRPHNSGHITMDAHVCCQFEQQVRAVCALPLGSTERSTPAAAMVNLMGQLWDPVEPAWHQALADPRARLHLYGKAEPRPGRKMGHLSLTAATLPEAKQRALDARAALTQIVHQN